jgi:hypothetical protein
MAERNRWRVFKGHNAAAFEQGIEQVLRAHGGAVFWGEEPRSSEDWLALSHDGDVHTIAIPYVYGADSLFCAALGKQLNVPWIELRIQEGALWDYSLFAAEAHLHTFSTCPEYWDDDEAWQATQRGSVSELAGIWQIPAERIDRYIRPWGVVRNEDGDIVDFALKGKAYPTDESGYRSIWQSLDFLKAIGGSDPLAHGASHRALFPKRDAYSNS